MCSGIQPVRTLRGVSSACGTAGKLTGGLRQSFFMVSKSVVYGAGGGTYEPGKSYPPMSFMYWFHVSML